MQAVTNPKIILHLDVNKTLIAEEKNNGKDLHLVLSAAIAEKTVYEWSPGALLHNSPQSTQELTERI